MVGWKESGRKSGRAGAVGGNVCGVADRSLWSATIPTSQTVANASPIETWPNVQKVDSFWDNQVLRISRWTVFVVRQWATPPW